MKRLLSEVNGVQKVDVKENKQNKLDNSVTATYDRTKTDRAAIAAKARTVWDIDWFECPCGKSSPVMAKC